MSFGFSIGDIILCSEIAYRLFSSVTDGRKRASRDLKELEDTLFGLYCALNHLQRDHKAILAQAPAESGDNAGQMHLQLGYMIRACLETLQELDSATAKYREAATESSRPSLGSQLSLTGAPSPQPAKTSLKIQWKRVMWDLRGDSFSKYRSKLQSHTDSINLLLNTFIWSATNRIEKDGTDQSQKLDEIMNQASQFNSNVLQLVRTLYAGMTMSRPQYALGPHGPMPSTGQFMAASLALPDAGQPIGTRSVEEIHFEVATLPKPTPRALPAIPLRASVVSHKIKQSRWTPPAWPSGQPLQLPSSIRVINEARQVVGQKEFEEHQRKLNVVSSAHQQRGPQPNPPEEGIPTVQKLSRQIENIFQTLDVPTSARVTTNSDLQTDIVAWVFGLDDLSEQLQVSPAVFGKHEKSAVIRDISKLLVTLNRLLEESKPENQGVFYDASKSRVDQVFARLRGLSTLCEKEIEEFEDERDDWKASALL
ncbi:uncharacterized protein N7482_009510 [Penicillium canariense]|uniref:Fungal N-terminal domain-containing protein n=1 Tax=Penicillium canariense TaxID=189055 RepID=A0A9W9HPE2_9EURO|nr:uncharacterized protein N7482_009510 [Penicillium canariense]KAJ5153032.1 hypothetical protein N7482_009510 [Penicillium canariense]